MWFLIPTNDVIPQLDKMNDSCRKIKSITNIVGLLISSQSAVMKGPVMSPKFKFV